METKPSAFSKSEARCILPTYLPITYLADRPGHKHTDTKHTERGMDVDVL